MDGRKLRNIESKRAIKVFEKAGGIIRKGKGSHINLKMPNGQIVTIPAKGEIKIGILKSVIHKSGLTEQEFIDLL